VPETSSNNLYTASFTVNAKNGKEFAQWKKAFEEKTHTQFNIRCTRQNKEAKFIFKQYLKCLHNVTRGKTGCHKHTACPARLTVTITRDLEGSKNDVDNANTTCLVNLTWTHNHPVLAADVIRHHRVNTTTDDKLIHLFRHGHSPSSALQCLRTEIEDAYEDSRQVQLALADRATFPDYQHCHYVFRKLFNREYGSPDSSAKLSEFVASINADQGELCIASEDYDSKSLVAICTPLMKRVHGHIEEAAELVFVDSSGGFDRDGFRVFMFLTHSKAGGRG